MADALAVTTVCLVLGLIGFGSWRAAGREAERAGLAVLAIVGVPALLVMGVLGAMSAGPLPAVVAGGGAAALLAGALRPAAGARRGARHVPVPVRGGQVAENDPELRRAA